MKKTILFLTLFLTFLGASAQDAFDVGLFKYVITSDDPAEAEVVGFADATTAAEKINVVIPATFFDAFDSKDFAITEIAESAFTGDSVIQSVVLSEGMLTMANNAFYGNKSLTSVTLPEGLLTIGDQVFRGAPLTAITLPNTLTHLGGNNFRDGPLLSLVLPNSITTLGTSLLYKAKSVSSLTLSSSLTALEDRGLYQANSLKELTIPASIVEFKESSFLSSAVTTLFMEGDVPPAIFVTVPVGGEVAKEQNWGGNPANITAYVPTDKVDVYKAAYMWSQMTILDIATYGQNQGTTEIVGAAFTVDNIGYKITSIDNLEVEVSGSTVTALTIPATVTNPGGSAFSVTAIGKGAFLGDLTLTSVVLPTSVIHLKGDAFSGCINLETINVESVLVTDQYNVFYNCQKLTTANLASITNIGKFMYFGTTSALTSVSIPNAVIIGKGAFRAIPISSINIPATVTSIEDIVFRDCTSLTEIQVNWTTAGAIVPVSVDGVNPANSDPLGTFVGVTRANVTLYVPAGTAALYGAVDVWKDFAIVEGTLGVKGVEKITASVYPNPTNGVVSVQTESQNDVELTVYDLSGRVLLSNLGAQIDISNLANGIYILKGTTEDGQFTKRIVKE